MGSEMCIRDRRRRRRPRRGRSGAAAHQHSTSSRKSNGTSHNNRSSRTKRKRTSAAARKRSTQRRHSRPAPRGPVSVETSAGGLVISGLPEAVNDRGEVDLSAVYVALIGRLDRRGRLLWSMPKGHVEPGEDHRHTAEREVWEETGIVGEVFADLGTIDYWFVSEGKRVHKTVHHHLLRYVDGELNDEDPEVTEVAWVPAAHLVERLAYSDERKLARIAHDTLPELARQEKKQGRSTPR